MKYINTNGITNSTSAIMRSVCDKNGYYLDLLEDGNWLVSKKDTKIALFSDCEEAVFYFMAKSEPLEQLSKEDEAEALEFLEQVIATNNKPDVSN